MPIATVTVRKLKNESSGLDLSIPTVKEIPGLLVDTVEYHILVVSKLHFFKLPQHKETDVVQFVIPKHYEDFENVRKGLALQYPGTILPTLPSSILPSFLESNTSERTLELEDFLKFVAQTPKLATSHVTLEFLGVNPVTAGKYTSNSSPKINSSSESPSLKSPADKSSSFQLFEENKEEIDLFGADVGKEDPLEDEIFSSKNVPTARRDTSKFLEQQFANLDTSVGPDDLKLFNVPTSDTVKSPYSFDTEDVSKLLEVEDEIAQLLKLEKTLKSKQKTESEGKKTDDPLFDRTKTSLLPKPAAVGKKPLLAPKPQNLSAGKPQNDQKGQPSFHGDREASASLQLGVDDILNYIKENPVNSEAEPDLFL